MNSTMLLAITTMSLGMSLIPLGDTFGKAMVANGVSPYYVGWTRYGIGALTIMLFTGVSAVPGLLLNWRVWVRGGLMAGGITGILMALRTEPLANAFGAFFVGPIVSYALSVWMLGERVSWPRTALLVLGFAGVMLVVRPGFGLTQGIAWAILAGTFYGAFLTSSRWLSGVTTPPLLLLATLLVGTCIMAPAGLTHLPAFTPQIAGLTLGSALASMLGNLLLVMAYRQAPASTLAPFVYVQLVSATALGWFIFGDWPDATAFAGLALILGSGLATLLLRRG